MDANRIAIFVLVLLVTSVIAGQEQTPLTINNPQVGEITLQDQSNTYAFTALGGDVFSFRVEAIGEFDPIMRLYNSDGRLIIANDDYNRESSRDALLEAITIPQTGEYIVEVSGYEESTGGYTLTMLPGYSLLSLDERFVNLDAWTTQDGAEANFDPGQPVLQIEGISQTGYLLHNTDEQFDNFYLSGIVSNIIGQNGWIVGIVFRMQDNGDHYAVLVNSLGHWRLTAQVGDEVFVIREWTPHPAIVPGDPDFALSVLANGTGFDVFYNGQLIGEASDSRITESGQVGLAVGTLDAMGSTMSVAVNNIIVTTPDQIEGESIIPQQLVDSTQTHAFQELERRHLVPGGGQLVLTVDESFVENRRPGVTPLLLGRGAIYERLALGTTVRPEVFGDGVVGCGLVAGFYADNNYYTAFIDNAGGFGVSRRSEDGFEPGIYAENADFAEADTHDLLLVLDGQMLHFYVDGLYVDSLETGPVDGGVGNIAINFDPVEAVCRFEDTWVWTW